MNKTTTSIVGLLLLLPIGATAQSAPADAPPPTAEDNLLPIAAAPSAPADADDDFSRWPKTYAFCAAEASIYTDGKSVTLQWPFRSEIFTVYRRPGVDVGTYNWLRWHLVHVLGDSRHVTITSDNRRRVTRFLKGSTMNCEEFDSITGARAGQNGKFFSASHFGITFPPLCQGVANSADIVIGTHCSW